MRVTMAGCRFCVGDRYYLVGARILCEADYEEHLRQFDVDQLQQLCNGHHQSVDVTSSSHLTTDGDITTTSDASPWYHHHHHHHQQHQQQQQQQQAVHGPRRFHSKTHKYFDDRSSGYGSPSPPCVWRATVVDRGSQWDNRHGSVGSLAPTSKLSWGRASFPCPVPHPSIFLSSTIFRIFFFCLFSLARGPLS